MIDETWAHYLAARGGGPGACWCPAVDVYRDGEGWLIKCDLAGVAPQDVQLAICGRALTIAGVRRDLTVRKGLRAHSLEIAYSRFERSVELPVDLRDFDIATESREGMFTISAQPREVSS